jgi:hypothetical protein
MSNKSVRRRPLLQTRCFSQVAAAVEAVLANARAGQAQGGLDCVVWRGKALGVRTAALRDAVLKAKTLASEVAAAAAESAELKSSSGSSSGDLKVKGSGDPAAGPSNALQGKCVAAFHEVLAVVQRLLSELDATGLAAGGGGASSRVAAERRD